VPVLSRRRVVLLCLGLLAAAFVAVLAGWFPQDVARRFVESRLQSLIGPASRLGALRVVPGRLRAEARDVVLDAKGYHLEVDRLQASLKPGDLFGPGLAVQSLRATGVRLTLRATEADDAPPPEPSVPIVVREVRLDNVSLRYETADPTGALVLEGVEVEGGLGSGSLALRARGGRWEGTRPVAIGPARARLRVTPRLDLEIEEADAGLERSRLRVSGRLGRPSALELDLALAGAVDLAEVTGAFGSPVAATGALALEGRIRGKTEAPVVEATITSAAFVAGGVEAHRLHARIHHGVEGPGLSTASLSVEALGGGADIEARAEGDRLRGKLGIRGLDAASLTRVAGLEAGLDGRLSGQGSFDGTLDAMRISAALEADGSAGGTAVRARARADGTIHPRKESAALQWTVDLAAPGDPEGKWENASVTAAGSAGGWASPMVTARLNGNVTVRGARPVNAVLEGDLQARGAHVEGRATVTGLGEPLAVELAADGTELRALSARGEALDLGLIVPGLTGQARLRLEASGEMERPSGQVRMEAQDLSWRDLALGPLVVEAISHAGAVEARATAPEWNVSATASLSLAEEARHVRGRVVLQETPLAPLRGLMPAGRDLEGTLSADAEFSLPTAEPRRAEVRAQVSRVEAASGPWAVHSVAPFRVAWAEETVAVEGLRIESAAVALEADGKVGGAGRGPLSGRLAARVPDLSALPWPGAWGVSGALAADLVLGGTGERPLADGQVTLQQVEARSPSLPSVRLRDGRLELQGSTMIIPSLAADVADGVVTLDGRVPLTAVLPRARRREGSLDEDEGVHLRVTWQGLQAAALYAASRPIETLPEAAPVRGALAGEADLSGGLAGVTEMRAHVSVARTDLSVEDMSVGLAPWTVDLDRGVLRARDFAVTAAGGTLEASGTVDFTRREIDASARGRLELRALSAVLTAAALRGTAEADLAVRGSLDRPQGSGTLRVRDATMRMRLLPQAMTDVNATFVLEGQQVRVTEGRARLGGGDLTLGGSATIGGRGLADADISVTGRGLSLEYPPGLRSRLDADLQLTGHAGALRLAGTVRAQRGVYDLERALRASMRAPATATEESPLLRSIGLDLTVETTGPVLVRSQMTRIQARGRLQVRGDLNAPSPIGSLDVLSGGTLNLYGREFLVTRARLSYRGDWDARLDMSAESDVQGEDSRGIRRDYTVRAGLEGSLERPGLVLSSDPPLSQGQVAKLLATGNPDAEGGGLTSVLGTQAATLVAGGLTGNLRRLGFDEVTLQPELVAREGESDTGARFTFGKRLNDRAKLVYSYSLVDPEKRYIQVETRPRTNVTASVKRRDDGVFAYGLGQRFQMGGPSRPRGSAAESVRIQEVRFSGSPEKDLESRLGTRTGRRRSTWDVQDDAERLRDELIKRGYLEAEVTGRLEGSVASFDVASGPRFRWRVVGMSQPPDLTSEIRASLHEDEALERGRRRLERELEARRQFRATVRSSAASEGDERTLLFEVVPGPVEAVPRVEFIGRRALSEGELVKAAGGVSRLLSDPAGAAADMAAAYHDRHYLGAEVDPPQVKPAATGSVIVVTIREKKAALVSSVRFEGATRPVAELEKAAALAAGSPYEPASVEAALERLRVFYFGQGHPLVRIVPSLARQGDDFLLTLRVDEGPRLTIGEVRINGLRRTRESVVRRLLNLQSGQPVDPRRLAGAERRVQDLGAFSRVAITFGHEDPALVTVDIEEGDKVVAGYLLEYEDDEDAGSGTTVTADAELRNLLGRGVTVGTRGKLGGDVREARAYVSVPWGRAGRRFIASGFYDEEDLPAEVEEGPPVENNRLERGFQLQAALPLRRRRNLLAGYRFERTRFTSPVIGFVITQDIAGLDVSYVQDRRDDPLDARRGHLFSLGLEYSPAWLASDFTFVKGTGQFFLSIPLTSSWTWAQGLRIGLGAGFGGQEIVSSERFRAGGANTLRGFPTDSVGPVDVLGEPAGGEALLVLNQELRFHHRSGLGGVFFYDGGSVFPTIQDFGEDIRHTLGTGLRWASPVGLLRLDVGFPLARRENEKAYRIFFSLGQAF
jgi:outer membrane protein assembly factor BamA/autotransporter translocation and assembly factor TamB